MGLTNYHEVAYQALEHHLRLGTFGQFGDRLSDLCAELTDLGENLPGDLRPVLDAMENLRVEVDRYAVNATH